MYRTRPHTEKTVKVVNPQGEVIAYGDMQYMSFMCQQLNDKMELVYAEPQKLSLTLPQRISNELLKFVKQPEDIGRYVLDIKTNGTLTVRFIGND